MITKLKQYIENAFTDIPQTKASLELKEELTSNLIEKYNDYLLNGKTESEAYQLVIKDVGDLNELTASLKSQPVDNIEQRKKSGLLKAIAIGLYILSPMALIGVSELTRGSLGLITMFAFIAVATGLLIYNSTLNSTYEKQDETMMEEFKEWQSKKNNRKESYNLFFSAYWFLVVALYLYISFTTFLWHITWIIFLIATAIAKIAEGLIALNDTHEK